MSRHRLGLIINPIAGMGGAVGLKGTDGSLAARARQLGAVPVAAGRASIALDALAGLADDLEILTAAGDMGADVVRAAGLSAQVLYAPARQPTNAGDTRDAASRIVAAGVDLLLFVGGDGTARELPEVVGDRVAVLGVPSGVKMHSAVFAASPRAAGEVARRFLQAEDRRTLLADAEVLDRDPLAADERSWSPALFGTLRTPRISFLVPPAKSATGIDADAALDGALARVAEDAADQRVTIVGPGATMRKLKKRLGADGTLLGVDLFADGKCIATDADERSILRHIEGRAARIVLSVVGGQGFLFGRGNQQLSPRVIRAVGPENVVVVSSMEKLAALDPEALLVDTGDETLDRELAGHRPVIVSGSRTVMMPVRDAAVRETDKPD